MEFVGELPRLRAFRYRIGGLAGVDPGVHAVFTALGPGVVGVDLMVPRRWEDRDPRPGARRWTWVKAFTSHVSPVDECRAVRLVHPRAPGPDDPMSPDDPDTVADVVPLGSSAWAAGGSCDLVVGDEAVVRLVLRERKFLFFRRYTWLVFCRP